MPTSCQLPRHAWAYGAAGGVTPAPGAAAALGRAPPPPGSAAPARRLRTLTRCMRMMSPGLQSGSSSLLGAKHMSTTPAWRSARPAVDASATVILRNQSGGRQGGVEGGVGRVGARAASGHGRGGLRALAAGCRHLGLSPACSGRGACSPGPPPTRGSVSGERGGLGAGNCIFPPASGTGRRLLGERWPSQDGVFIFCDHHPRPWITSPGNSRPAQCNPADLVRV